MKDITKEIDFTGEYFVPGKSGDRIEDDHMARYIFASNFVKDCTVLDIACGFGYAGPLLIKSGASKYLGVDINTNLVENAKSLYGRDNVFYIIGDICKYKSSELFDVVICFETIEHVKEYEVALGSLYHAIKEDGVLLISSPNRHITSPDAKNIWDPPANPHHTQEFTPKELINILSNSGFYVESSDIYGQRNSFLYFRSTYMRQVVNKFYGDPSAISSSEVRRFHLRSPRYFVLVAFKKKKLKIWT